MVGRRVGGINSMNNHLNRIYHFKGNPREIGFAAGHMLGNKLEQTLSHYIAGRLWCINRKVGAIRWWGANGYATL